MDRPLPMTEWERLQSDLIARADAKAAELAAQENMLQLERSAAHDLGDLIGPVMLPTARGKLQMDQLLRGYEGKDATWVRVREFGPWEVGSQSRYRDLLTVEIRVGPDLRVQYLLDDEEIARDEVLEAVASVVRHYGILD